MALDNAVPFVIDLISVNEHPRPAMCKELEGLTQS